MRSSRRRNLLAAGLAVLALAAFPGIVVKGRAQTVDGIAAVVNGNAITLVDLKIAVRFGLTGAGESSTLEEALGQIIERALVIGFAGGQIAVPADELEAFLKGLSSRMGPEEWRRNLEEFGLDEKDLKPYLEEYLLFRKILEARFSRVFPITIREIEDHYRNVYVPESKNAGAEPLPLVQVLDRIESRLQNEKRKKQIADWIANLKRQADIRIHEGILK
jgi:hypothetical protein